MTVTVLKREITLGNLLSILLSSGAVVIGFIISINVRLSTSEEVDRTHDLRIIDNRETIHEVNERRELDRNETQNKLDRILELMINK